jgi:ribonuclease VapC
VIVVDTSAIIAIICDEQAARSLHQLLLRTPEISMSAGTFAEGLIVSARKGIRDQFASAVSSYSISIISLTPDRAGFAADAYDRWGKGVHPAGLNICDCFAYALAKELDWPLLYVGEDFAKTDVAPALAA